IFPVPTGETDEGEARRQEATIREVINRRHELLARQVPGHTEDYERAWPSDSIESTIGGKAQRVKVARDLHRAHQLTVSISVATPPLASISVNVRTGRPCSARTLASPAACACKSSPKVKGRSGIARS